MEVTINEKVKKYDVVVNQTTKQINVNIVNQSKQTLVTISPLGPRGYSANLSELGNYERDWAQDFLVMYNT